ncbi:MAG: tRNA pseudouridine(38-40) synthase TruA, partial [Acidimicrobiales bacterium]
MVVAYDGTGFHGFALQPGQRTVASALCAALERYLRPTVALTCAGRTDAGVHAWGQVVSFDAREDVDPAAMQRAVNRALRHVVGVAGRPGPAIVLREASLAPPGFD